MHKLNTLIFGPKDFFLTLNELKPFLKFNLVERKKDLSKKMLESFDVLIVHDEYKFEKNFEEIFYSAECIKIVAKSNLNKKFSSFDGSIKLPTTIKDLNDTIEISAAKKKFNFNSSIKIKKYFLNKNEKKLIKDETSIVLTEKEVQLLDTFMKSKKPLSKSSILSKVWHYSSSADTHTVETHIYRLRKKISEKFFDEDFILNNKEGYYL